MNSQGDGAKSAVPFMEGVHRTVSRLRLVAAGVWLALALVAGLAVLLVVLRALHPVKGGFAPVVAAGVLALVGLGAGATALGLTDRKARRAGSLGEAANHYRVGCLIAGASNFAVSCVTLGVLWGCGVSGGLWVPQLLVLAVNLLGLLLAVPRLKHLRSLHYRPMLPLTKV
jgi:hypothetical protein